MNWKMSSTLLAACGLVLGLAGCGGDQGASPNAGAPTNVPAEMAGNAPANAPTEAAGNAPAAANTPAEAGKEGGKTAASGDAVKVVMETSKGTIELELYPKKAPITVENFLGYVKKGHYNGTIFHRVIPGFMIQGGGFTPDLKEKETGKPIKNEAGNGLTNDRGTIAMARTPVVDSATAQFFINVNDNVPLNHTDDTPEGFGYAVFGKVTKGMDVADKIVSVTTGEPMPGMRDVPVEPVLIKSVKVAQ